VSGSYEDAFAGAFVDHRSIQLADVADTDDTPVAPDLDDDLPAFDGVRVVNDDVDAAIESTNRMPLSTRRSSSRLRPG
jgi:hypothetical protein